MAGYSVKELALFIQKEKDNGRPFVIFTGAGCSKSAGIPLASELVKEINEKFELELKGLSEAKRQDYGECMAAIGKDERRRLIKTYIDKSKLNWTHIVLALLMDNGYVNRVLTFNFDNILIRSCGLLGMYPSIYDFTAANLDLQNLIVEPAIVHLHGQSHGFSQLNTAQETSDHAEVMSHFVASTLSQSPSLFVGYSGQADAFFPKLRDKYSGQHRLFWVGRSKTPSDNINNTLIERHSVAHYIQSNDSDLFFIQLAQALGCFPPKIFTDPYGHLIDELSTVMDFPTIDSTVDLLSDLRGKLLEDQKLKLQDIDIELLFMKGNYDEVIRSVETIERELSNEEVKVLAWTYVRKGLILFDMGIQESSLEKLDECIEFYKKSLELDNKFFAAISNWGLALTHKGRIDENELYFIESIDKYSESLKIEDNKASVYFNYGLSLFDLGEIKKDKSYYFEAIKKYEKAIYLKNDYWDVFDSYGLALSRLAVITGEDHYFQSSIEKFEHLLDNRVDHQASANLALTYMDQAKIKSGEEETKLFLEAEKILLELEKYLPKDSYNLACLYGLLNNKERCKEKLLNCVEFNNYPSKKYVVEDPDLQNVVGSDWFCELIERL